jgi:RNA polymerase sigma factor (sigma-70 family)
MLALIQQRNIEADHIKVGPAQSRIDFAAQSMKASYNRGSRCSASKAATTERETPLAFAARIGTAARDADEAGSAFERLFRSEYPKVAAIARRIVFDGHAAEDIAQEVFVSFHRLHAPDVPFASKWLHTAAVHTALNEVRGRKRRVRREIADAAANLSASRGDDPLEAVASVELRATVAHTLGRINPKYAAVLAMRYAGLSYAEIADALGVSANHVGTMLRRAEAAFKKEHRNDPS